MLNNASISTRGNFNTILLNIGTIASFARRPTKFHQSVQNVVQSVYNVKTGPLLYLGHYKKICIKVWSKLGSLV